MDILRGWRNVLPFLVWLASSDSPRHQEAALFLFALLTLFLGSDAFEPYFDFIYEILRSFISSVTVVPDVRIAALNAVVIFTAGLSRSVDRRRFQHLLPAELIGIAHAEGSKGHAHAASPVLNFSQNTPYLGGIASQLLVLLQNGMQMVQEGALTDLASDSSQAWARLCQYLRQDFLPYMEFVMPPLLQSAPFKPVERECAMDIEGMASNLDTLHQKIGAAELNIMELAELRGRQQTRLSRIRRSISQIRDAFPNGNLPPFVEHQFISLSRGILPLEASIMATFWGTELREDEIYNDINEILETILFFALSLEEKKSKKKSV